VKNLYDAVREQSSRVSVLRIIIGVLVGFAALTLVGYLNRHPKPAHVPYAILWEDQSPRQQESTIDLVVMREALAAAGAAMPTIEETLNRARDGAVTQRQHRENKVHRHNDRDRERSSRTRLPLPQPLSLMHRLLSYGAANKNMDPRSPCRGGAAVGRCVTKCQSFHAAQYSVLRRTRYDWR
jgi:hypothetical protein